MGKLKNEVLKSAKAERQLARLNSGVGGVKSANKVTPIQDLN